MEADECVRGMVGATQVENQPRGCVQTTHKIGREAYQGAVTLPWSRQEKWPAANEQLNNSTTRAQSSVAVLSPIHLGYSQPPIAFLLLAWTWEVVESSVFGVLIAILSIRPLGNANRFPAVFLSWLRGSVVRASVSGWWTFPDLWLTWHVCDHVVPGKVSAMGQPTRPTQPSIPPVSVNE